MCSSDLIGHIAGEQDIEVVKVGLLQAFVQIVDLLGRGLGTFDLLVRSMIACSGKTSANWIWYINTKTMRDSL